MKTVIEIARDAGWAHCDTYSSGWLKTMERFAELVRADERDRAIEEANRRANASWTLMCEKMVAAEREACAKVCDLHCADYTREGAEFCAAAIRARSNT